MAEKGLQFYLKKKETQPALFLNFTATISERKGDCNPLHPFFGYAVKSLWIDMGLMIMTYPFYNRKIITIYLRKEKKRKKTPALF